MSNPDPWCPLGGRFRQFNPTQDKAHLPLEPIMVAGILLLARVLVGMRSMKWLVVAIGIVRDGATFLKHSAKKDSPHHIQ